MKCNNAVRLMLLLSRTSLSDEELRSAGALVGEGLDWDLFLHKSMLNGVAPLIYSNISAVKDVPEGVIEALKAAYHVCLRETVVAAELLSEVVGALEGEGMQVIVLKGITISAGLMQNPALYPSVDIDLLIRPENLSKAVDVMGRLGYETDSVLDEYYASSYNVIYFHCKGRTPVEIHTSLGKRRFFDIPSDFWWEGHSKWDYEGRLYSVLSPERALFYAAIHAFSHAYVPLKFCVALSEMLRRHGKDVGWDGFMYEARRFDASSAVALSFMVSEIVTGISLPVAGVYEDSRPGQGWVAGRISANYCKDRVMFATLALLLGYVRFGPAGLVLKIFRWLLPPPGELRNRYGLPSGSPKILAYYLLNPVLLLLRKKNT